MPPHSTSLQQEGAVFLSFKLVQGGVFQEEGEWHWAGTPGCFLPTLPPGRPPGWESQVMTPQSGCTVSLTHNQRRYLSHIIRGAGLSCAWAQEGLNGLGVGSWPGHPRVQEREKPASRWAAASVYNSCIGLHWVWGLQAPGKLPWAWVRAVGGGAAVKGFNLSWSAGAPGEPLQTYSTWRVQGWPAGQAWGGEGGSGEGSTCPGGC